jgi:hypothetical protein
MADARRGRKVRHVRYDRQKLRDAQTLTIQPIFP